MTFAQQIAKRKKQNNSLLCVGLDPDYKKLPNVVRSNQFTFCRAIVDATAEYAAAFKPNTAFFEALGAEGIEHLRATCDYIKTNHPDIPIILDAKRADIGNTNKGYARFAFNYCRADALTVHPYLGGGALEPLLNYSDKGIFVLARTSNESAGDLQDISVGKTPLYLEVVKQAVKGWNTYGNIMFVAGATYPEELAVIRKAAGKDTILLIPGVGVQGGNVDDVIKNGGENILINSSRGIIFASGTVSFAEHASTAAKKLYNKINKAREANE